MPEDLNTLGQEEHRLKKLVVWIALSVSLAVAIAIPLLFFLTAFNYKANNIEEEIKDISVRLSRFIYTTPKTWQFDENRIIALLNESRRNSIKNFDIRPQFKVYDRQGELIVSIGVEPSFPVFKRSAFISDGFNDVGAVEIIESYQSVLISTALAGALGIALAGTVFMVLWSLPLRVLDKALNSLDKSQIDLRRRVLELQVAKQNLEKQKKALKEAANKLSFARDEAETANKAKTEFLANMSHELRTPLNAILGFSEVIHEQLLGKINNKKYLEYAYDIHQSGSHLLEVINSILDVSRIEAGHMTLDDTEIDVKKVIESCLSLISDRAQKANCKVIKDVQKDIPSLLADETKLKQIFLNLLSNAVKFTHEKGKVTLTALINNKGDMVFIIEDNGIGIESDHIELVLKRFAQAGNPLNRKHQGTGLGLPLTKSLVELHGGELILESQKNIGTKVTVTFPKDRIIAAKKSRKTA